VTLSAEEQAELTREELARLRHHELEVARIWVAAAERRKRAALARLRAAKRAARAVRQQSQESSSA